MADWNAVYRALAAYAPKALGTKEYRDEDGVCCALGAVGGARYPTTDAGDSDDFAHHVRQTFALTGEEHGDVFTENDRFKGTPEERYVYMLAWVKEKAKVQNG